MARDGDIFCGLRLAVAEGAEDPRLAEALGAEVAERFGPRGDKLFSLTLRDANDALAAGANGVAHWRWLYVRHLWVAASWRGRGLGRDLLKEVERRAACWGCVGVYLDTFSPEAVAFYRRCGFTPCGAIEDFPPGERRTFLQKRL